MWTSLPCQNFHLLVCCAILDSEKQKIMDRKYGFNEILKVSINCILQTTIQSFFFVITILKCLINSSIQQGYIDV